MKNTFMRIRKNNSNSNFDNMLYKYKNTFNINKLLKITYNFNYKKNSMINKKLFIIIKYINIYLTRIYTHLYY